MRVDIDWFEEMVLIPVVKEIRNASPQIVEVTDMEIVVDLGCVCCFLPTSNRQIKTIAQIDCWAQLNC